MKNIDPENLWSIIAEKRTHLQPILANGVLHYKEKTA